jgi:predicted transposase YbfD/YdcC
MKVLFSPTLTATTVEKGHGRIETRTITLLPLLPGQIGFPFSSQIYSIERIFFNISKNKTSTETIFGITSLSGSWANAERILALNRDHWTIENKSHYVRDVTMGEDGSRIRKGSGPRVMAIFRNLTLSLLRKIEITNIAEKIKMFCLEKNTLFRFVGIGSAIKN